MDLFSSKNKNVYFEVLKKEKEKVSAGILNTRLFATFAWTIIALIFGVFFESPGLKSQFIPVIFYFLSSLLVWFSHFKLKFNLFPPNLLVPFVDVPFIFWVQSIASDARPENIHPVTLMAGISVILFMITLLSFDKKTLLWVIISCFILQVFLELKYQLVVGDMAGDLLVIIVAGSTAYYLLSSYLNLIQKISLEQNIKQKLTRYFSPSVAQHISEINPSSLRREVTVMVVDIRNFTRLSEKLDPEKIVSLLNQYFEKMVHIIFENKGTLDKFMGDGILAYFGAPVSLKNHADHGINCAIQMCKGLIKLNQERRKNQIPQFEIGIALHTGPVIVGDIGSSQRREYTVIGDTVNLASRLEGLTKKYNSQIIISEETVKRSHHKFNFKELGDAPVRGRNQSVKIYTLELT